MCFAVDSGPFRTLPQVSCSLQSSGTKVEKPCAGKEKPPAFSCACLLVWGQCRQSLSSPHSCVPPTCGFCARPRANWVWGRVAVVYSRKGHLRPNVSQFSQHSPNSLPFLPHLFDHHCPSPRDFRNFLLDEQTKQVKLLKRLRKSPGFQKLILPLWPVMGARTRTSYSYLVLVSYSYYEYEYEV